MMDRAELVVLHAALETVLAWPDSVRDQVAAWLAPTAQSGNGVDPHPPVAPTKEAKVRPAKRKPDVFSAKTAERKLIEAMRDNPNLSVIALANAAGSSRSATGERLRQMAARGLVARDTTGRWKLKGEETARQPAQGAEAGPMLAPPS